MNHDLGKFLRTLFNSDEQVCTGNMYDVVVHDQLHCHGNFISINPLKDKRADANVTAYRNFLIEMDEPSLSMKEQMDAVFHQGLPFSTATWSGGKSVHFIVSLQEELDETTWRRWAEALIRAIPGADPATKNPSRFTRLPGSFRRDKQTSQDLLYAGSRIPNTIVEEFVKPHIRTEMPDYRALYNELRGVTGLDAAHPMTKAFIAGTHPCSIGRNNALFRSACDLRDVGMSLEEIGGLLHEPAQQLGLSDKEIIQTIKSAYARKRRTA
jgi:hypothetical protein